MSTTFLRPDRLPREATQRRNLTRTGVGRFDGHRYEPISHHELDFGTDCYAMQV